MSFCLLQWLGCFDYFDCWCFVSYSWHWVRHQRTSFCRVLVWRYHSSCDFPLWWIVNEDCDRFCGIWEGFQSIVTESRWYFLIDAFGLLCYEKNDGGYVWQRWLNYYVACFARPELGLSYSSRRRSVQQNVISVIQSRWVLCSWFLKVAYATCFWKMEGPLVQF